MLELIMQMMTDTLLKDQIMENTDFYSNLDETAKLILALQQSYLKNEATEESRHALLFEELSINHNMFRILRYLYTNKKAEEPSVLSEILYIVKPTVTNTLDNLEKRQLISRKPHPTDRRKLLICLEPKGIELIEKAIAIDSDYHNRVISAFSKEELTEYLKMRNRMAEAREQAVKEILAERQNKKAAL